jgi:hypothetical protein
MTTEPTPADFINADHYRGVLVMLKTIDSAVADVGRKCDAAMIPASVMASSNGSAVVGILQMHVSAMRDIIQRYTAEEEGR